MFSVPKGIGLVEARKLIDEEYRNCEKRLLLLKSQRNTFTNIARIPDEVLLHIFSILKTESNVNNWFFITHVCRHWRDVSINAPTLWTNPPTHLHELTVQFLKRSMPLCLNIHFVRKTSTATAVAISNQIWRVQTLDMGRVDLDSLLCMQETLLRSNYEAPNLKQVVISSVQGDFKLSASTFRKPVLLEKLQLRFMDFDWTLLPLPNLTSLSLTQMDLSTGLTWENFVETLGAMPLLKSLRIHLLEMHLHAPLASVEQIIMPQLSDLKLSGASDAQIRYFISKFTLPQLDKAQVNCTTRESNENDLTTIQALSCLIADGNFGVLDTILLGHGNLSLCHHSNRSNKEFSFSYKRYIRTEQEAVNIITNSMLKISSLNYGGVSTLVCASLRGFGTPTDNDIVNLFADLPLLETITLCDEMAMPFIERLFISVSTPPTGDIQFANLKVISFYEEEETQFCSELFSKLLTCLMQRCEYNAPIHELLISWTVTKEDLKILKEVVVDVEFELYGGIVQSA